MDIFVSHSLSGSIISLRRERLITPPTTAVGTKSGMQNDKAPRTTAGVPLRQDIFVPNRFIVQFHLLFTPIFSATLITLKVSTRLLRLESCQPEKPSVGRIE